MLKIAVVTRSFPNSAEPWLGRSVYETIRVIARQADVRVFYPNAVYPSLLKSRSPKHSQIDPSYSPPDVNVEYCDYPTLPLLSRPVNGWMAARVLLPHVRSFAPDIVLGYFLYPNAFAALKIGQALSVPVVARTMGSDVNAIGDRISAMHTRTVLHQADFLVMVSDDLRRKCVAMGASDQKIRTIVNGCDDSVFHLKDKMESRQKLHIDPTAEVVVYLGRMDSRKGLRELVDAAAALHPQRPNLHIYMVGKGPDTPLLKTAIEGHNATAYIHTMPDCAFDDVPVWMAAADAVTLPSYMEGCPNVVLEALACGRPVVATKVGGIPEIMSEQCGQLVLPRNADDLARGLASVLDRTWNAEAIAAHGGRSWNTVAAEMLEVIEPLVANRKKMPPPAHR